jgi:radical SAM protein with 4Fe4S-binding SPASM domain
LKHQFSKINIEISNICNLQCSFCPEVLREKKMMSVELFEKIISQVHLITKQVCLHLMGDPLVHPKLEEFIKICEKYNVRIFFVTNGVLLRDDKIDLLLHPIIEQINFSLHSYNDNFPDKDPTVYLDKIFTFTEKAFTQRPDLYINYRLWNLNTPQGLDSKNTTVFQKIEDHYQVSLDKQINVYSEKSIKIKNRLYMHYDTEFIWPNLNFEIMNEKGTCKGLKSHFGILADGTVVPCCLDKEAGIPLGNIQSDPIQTILTSPRAIALKEGFKKRILIEELCKRCNYIERFA